MSKALAEKFGSVSFKSFRNVSGDRSNEWLVTFTESQLESFVKELLPVVEVEDVVVSEAKSNSTGSVI